MEVGQIFSIKDQGLTFLARVLNIEHSSNYDGHWDTTMKGTQFFDGDQIFNRVIAQPLGCINKRLEFKKSRTLPTKFASVSASGERGVRVFKPGDGRHRGRIPEKRLATGGRDSRGPAQRGHGPPHGRLRHHRHGQVQLHEGLCRLMHATARAGRVEVRASHRRSSWGISERQGSYQGTGPSQEIPGGARLLFHRQAERLRSGRGGAGHIGKRDSSGGYCSAL